MSKFSTDDDADTTDDDGNYARATTTPHFFL